MRIDTSAIFVPVMTGAVSPVAQSGTASFVRSLFESVQNWPVQNWPAQNWPVQNSSPQNWFAHTVPLAIPAPVAIGILLVAALLSIPRGTWEYFGLFTTLVHELGHAVAAILTGRVVRGIRIRRNHSGDAMSTGRGRLGTVVSGVFGYPAPAIVGYFLLWSVFNGYTAIALFVGGIVLVLTLVVIRNLFGALVVLVSAALSAALWFYAPAAVQSYALLVLAIALLVGSVRGLATVIGVHLFRRDQLSTSDAWLLAKRTHVPSFFWLALFFLLIAGSCTLSVLAFLAR